MYVRTFILKKLMIDLPGLFVVYIENITLEKKYVCKNCIGEAHIYLTACTHMYPCTYIYIPHRSNHHTEICMYIYNTALGQHVNVGI